VVNEAFRISRAIASDLVARARAEPKLECCGLLAGQTGAAEEIFPARNLLNSATAYEIAPEELLSHFRAMRERGLELAGIYHSHPTGENAPSKTDIALAYYPSTPFIIIAPRENAPNPIRAFLIAEGEVSEMTVEIV
jgi:[CysO sulfur-carrier protein]-S-L-cysteine hydrolase